MYLVKKIWNPEIFQGKYRNRNYFEGWYYKLSDKSNSNVFAFIPGVSYGKSKNDSYAFIQFIDAVKCQSYYFKYDISKFKYSVKSFEVRVGDCFFSRDCLHLEINDQNFIVSGTLTFKNISRFPKALTNPGVMGPYSFIPFMECYHGIINIHHEITGSLHINGKLIDFDEGYGYIEKDWGRSFPESWVWMQSNHFKTEDVSFMFSVAKIPWLHTHFTGFLSYLKLEDKALRFATYTGAKISKFELTDNLLNIEVEAKNNKLTIQAKYLESGILKAPKNGIMSREIHESISSQISINLYDKNNNLIFKDTGRNAGMEIAGEVAQFHKR